MRKHDTPFTLTFLLLSALLLITSSKAVIILWDRDDNPISIFENVDLPGINNPNYGNQTGAIHFARFLGDLENPCLMESISDEIVALIVPFEDAYQVGCRTYARIIQR